VNIQSHSINLTQTRGYLSAIRVCNCF